MMKKEEAKKILSNCPDDKRFWVNKGPVLRNLDELKSALAGMSNETYHFHANNNKNDFSNWVSAVIGDTTLAMDITNAHNRQSALDRVSSRLDVLKRIASGH